MPQGSLFCNFGMSKLPRAKSFAWPSWGLHVVPLAPQQRPGGFGRRSRWQGLNKLNPESHGSRQGTQDCHRATGWNVSEIFSKFEVIAPMPEL
jgi:hypothetical protein